MKITLAKLTLINFKGLRNLEVNFSDITNISGDNKLGKSTIMDSFIWLIFGKDSQDRKDFEIKTLDENNKAISIIDHSVEGNLLIGERELSLKRIYREKWQKKRGSEESEFTGHETIFEIDGVAVSAGDYKAKIDSILKEDIFKMITNPHFFNNQLKWEERRKVLIGIAGKINDNELAALKPDFKKLIDFLTGKSFDEYKREISAKKKKIKDELQLIPARIDEVSRSIPQEPNYTELEKELSEINSQVAVIDSKITDISKANEEVHEARVKEQNKMYALKQDLQQIVFNAKTEAQQSNNLTKGNENTARQELESKQQTAERFQQSISNFKKAIEGFDKSRDELLTKWNDEDAKTVVFGNDFTCPSCKRAYETEDIEKKKSEITANFNTNKVSILKSITAKGLQINKEKESVQKELAEVESKIEVLNKEIESLKEQVKTFEKSQTKAITFEEILAKDKKYSDLEKEIKALEEKLSQPYSKDSDEKLKSDKHVLQLQSDGIKSQLSARETIAKSKARIEELKAEMKTLSQSLASLEKTEFIMEDFTRTKMNMVESRVNSMFKMCKFKMFKTLINGGIEETCETLVDGVPYPTVNNAGQINAGRDIINVLSSFYDISAPCFVDNAEAVNELLPINAQDIRLIVTKDKQLKIS